MPDTSRASIYEEVTSRIIRALENNAIPWRKPWKTGGPVNAVSKRHYRGVNVLLLELTALERGFTSNGWITYQAARARGGHVRKGEKATAVVWWDKRLKQRKDIDHCSAVEGREGDAEHVWLMRTCSVFSLDQCEGLDALRDELVNALSEFEPLEECLRIIVASGADISHNGSAAYYNPLTDSITLPSPTRFASRETYYATLFHELSHRTGASHRLNRQFGKRFGDEHYAVEELVAELSAAFACMHCGIDHVSQAAAYMKGWLDILRRDERAIFAATRQATEAADYLVGQKEQKEALACLASPAATRPSPCESNSVRKSPRACL